MKATAIQAPVQPQPFPAVTVTITLESQAEVDALFAVGNWNSQIGDLLAKKQNSPTGYRPALDQFTVAQTVLPFFRELEQFATVNRI